MIKVIRLSDQKEFPLTCIYKIGDEEGVMVIEDGIEVRLHDQTYGIINHGESFVRTGPGGKGFYLND